jgi:hypothetical protein
MSKNLITVPKMLMIAGITLTIISALTTNWLVKGNNRQIMELSDKSSEIEKNIDRRFEEKKTLDRQEDTMMLLLGINSEKSHTILKSYLNKITGNKQGTPERLLGLVINGNTEDFIKELEGETSVHKSKIISDIDDMYIEKITMDEKKNEIDSKNSTFSAIALFLQIAGMILVVIGKEDTDISD